MRFVVLWLIFFIDTSYQLVYYSKRYDYYDIDFLIENPRLLKGYLMCFISRGPCSPDGKTFKAHRVRAFPVLCGNVLALVLDVVTRLQFDVQKERAPDTDNDPYTHYIMSSNSIALAAEVGRFRHRSSGFIVANIKALSLSTEASYSGSANLSKRKKMHYFLIVCLAAAAYGADLYNSKYDNFDVDTLISNDRLLKSYINCFLDKGRCTPEGADFKKTLPEAVETTCAKCTEKQKQLIRKVIRAIQQKHPKQWEELQKKADPTGKFRANFDKFISESR